MWDINDLIDKAKSLVEKEQWLKKNYPGCILGDDADAGIFLKLKDGKFNRGEKHWIMPDPNSRDGQDAWERMAVAMHAAQKPVLATDHSKANYLAEKPEPKRG